MAMTRVVFRGKRLNTRTRDMVLAAEKLLGYNLTIIQGSYNSGGVAASAGTHDGGGAVDVWGKGTGDAATVANVMRRVGFAAWHRTPAQGNWGHHVHAIAIGDAELSRGARNQVASYKSGHNGLASNGKDTFSRAYVNNTWETYKATAKPVDVKPTIPAQTFHTLSIKAGTKNQPLSAWTKNEVEMFLSYAVQTGALSVANRTSWFNVTKAGNWEHAAAIVLQTVKNVQNLGKLTVDGVFGPQTAAYVNAHPRFNVIING